MRVEFNLLLPAGSTIYIIYFTVKNVEGVANVGDETVY